jgi:hypothetical protein
MPDDNGLLEQLTQDAIEAAREGKWGQVIALYDSRMSQGQLKDLSPDIARKLVKWDQWLLIRVREAQAAIQQNLMDIQDKRRKLEILKRQWGGNSTVEARHLLTI